MIYTFICLLFANTSKLIDIFEMQISAATGLW